ncbi:MAG: hypothetical protein JG781_88 [Peptococcaceae bacterium]|jgi:hypothetical protein|uniref:Uncharacterized protein n=1 Tax=Thermanaerosceptrum fracticalcis TaxID=1712410 RepID=A0A7G6E098_THEFR|nr:hypothetical protein [Thermanaerosceptrum fracticalcis]MBZ4652750.1 hypothetical protein [Peptococcaceae bacterium]QNB45502.1 hypothetical protein BR63_03725 [Thermanaerosceptrum fracticalcis]
MTNSVISGENACRLCNDKLVWAASFPVQAQAAEEGVIVPEIVTTDFLNGADGVYLKVKVNVKCPQCGITNRYDKLMKK